MTRPIWILLVDRFMNNLVEGDIESLSECKRLYPFLASKINFIKVQAASLALHLYLHLLDESPNTMGQYFLDM